MSSPPVWLVTGSSGGLGWALTRYIASQGHVVVASSRDPSRTPELAGEIESKGGKWISLDVTWPADRLTQVVHDIEKEYGYIDYLVNNAGYSLMGAVEDLPDHEIVAQMEANFFGPMRLIKAVLPGMRRRGTGTILTISSAQGLCPSPSNAAYAASKAALEAFSESLSFEVRPLGLRILIFELGAFKTDFADASKTFQPSPAYDADDHPVAQRVKHIKTLSKMAKGSPDKAARIIFEAATGEGETGRMIMKEEFLRVIVGPDGWKRIDQKVTELRRTTDTLRDVAASSDL